MQINGYISKANLRNVGPAIDKSSTPGICCPLHVRRRGTRIISPYCDTQTNMLFRNKWAASRVLVARPGFCAPIGRTGFDLWLHVWCAASLLRVSLSLLIHTVAHHLFALVSHHTRHNSHRQYPSSVAFSPKIRPECAARHDPRCSSHRNIGSRSREYHPGLSGHIKLELLNGHYCEHTAIADVAISRSSHNRLHASHCPRCSSPHVHIPIHSSFRRLHRVFSL